MSRKQSLAAALKSPTIRRALNGLNGCPVGGWGETEQSMRQLSEALPFRSDRSYSMSELVDAALVEDQAGRLRWREARS